jgi:excisionase family DNA binding protein
VTTNGKTTPADALSAPSPMKAPEVARRLGVSLAAVYRLAAAGTLPAHRVTERTWAFDPRDVEAYWERCRRGHGDDPGPVEPERKGVRPRKVPRIY